LSDARAQSMIMKLYPFWTAWIILLCLLYLSHGYCSDLKFDKPGSKELVPIEEKDVGIAATEAVVSALNEMLHSNDKSEKAYRRYFGVEPEGVLTGMGSKGVSGFLNCLFTTLSSDGSSVSGVALRILSNDQCWKLSETGDYTTFAAIIDIQGSRYKSAIIMIRVEILDSMEIPGARIATARPSRFYVSLK